LIFLKDFCGGRVSVLCVPKKREDLFRGRQESTTTTTTTVHGEAARADKAQLWGLLHASHYRAWADFVDLAHTRFKPIGLALQLRKLGARARFM